MAGAQRSACRRTLARLSARRLRAKGWTGLPLLLGARDVFAGARVDADHFAFVDEERHAHYCARLELGGLLAAGGGVAPQPRVSLHDLQLDVRRRRHHQRHVVPQCHDADHTVLEPLRALTDRGLAGGVLLEVIRHHEMPEVPVLIEVLHLGVDDVGRLERFARLEGSLDRAAGLEVAYLDAVERLALAGLDELILDHRVGIAIEQDFETAADLAGGVAGHLLLTPGPARMRGPLKRAAYDSGIPRPSPPGAHGVSRCYRCVSAGSARRLTRALH